MPPRRGELPLKPSLERAVIPCAARIRAIALITRVLCSQRLKSALSGSFWHLGRIFPLPFGRATGEQKKKARAFFKLTPKPTELIDWG